LDGLPHEIRVFAHKLAVAILASRFLDSQAEPADMANRYIGRKERESDLVVRDRVNTLGCPAQRRAARLAIRSL